MRRKASLRLLKRRVRWRPKRKIHFKHVFPRQMEKLRLLSGFSRNVGCKKVVFEPGNPPVPANTHRLGWSKSKRCQRTQMITHRYRSLVLVANVMCIPGPQLNITRETSSKSATTRATTTTSRRTRRRREQPHGDLLSTWHSSLGEQRPI